jgi:AraC-like DNA-binding protein
MSLMVPSGMARTHDLASRSLAPPSVEAVDPLSDVLQAVRLAGALFFHVRASRPWGIDVPEISAYGRFLLPRSPTIVSYDVVLEGTGWVLMLGAAPVPFGPGDILIFPHGDPHSLKSDPEVAPEYSEEDTVAFFREMAAGRLPFEIVEGGGKPPVTRFVCGYLGCDAAPFNPVLAALPPFLRVRRGGTPECDLLDRMLEFALARPDLGDPGSASVRLRLCELVFVEALRRHLGSLPESAGGWLAGLRDPAVGRALGLIHGDPARAWTLGELARAAGTSRAVLAARFAERVGCAPMRYLTRWRMQCAARRLEQPGARVGAIAHAVGYDSEAAFCRAFKRIAGVPPAAWRSRAAAELGAS